MPIPTEFPGAAGWKNAPWPPTVKLEAAAAYTA
jgi:hypothetical protein